MRIAHMAEHLQRHGHDTGAHHVGAHHAGDDCLGSGGACGEKLDSDSDYTDNNDNDAIRRADLRKALSSLASSLDFAFVLRTGALGCKADADCIDDYDTYTPTTGTDTKEHKISSMLVRDPPPERSVRARGSSDTNKTYFTRRPICRLTCTVNDASIIDSVTSNMLGPGADFGIVCVTGRRRASASASASSSSSDDLRGAVLHILANITNSVQIPDSGAEMGLVAVDILDGQNMTRMDPADVLALLPGT